MNSIVVPSMEPPRHTHSSRCSPLFNQHSGETWPIDFFDALLTAGRITYHSSLPFTPGCRSFTSLISLQQPHQIAGNRGLQTWRQAPTQQQGYMAGSRIPAPLSPHTNKWHGGFKQQGLNSNSRALSTAFTLPAMPHALSPLPCFGREDRIDNYHQDLMMNSHCQL